MVKSQSTGPVILLVDDNPQNLQILGKLLQEQKYKIEFALNGESSLEWLKRMPFDLILLDLNMPGMNGFEVCKRIRSDNSMHNMPIIFLSAESERESILKGFEVGAQDYVTKPFDNRELLARVKTQLDLKSKTEKLQKINEWLGKKVDNWLKTSMSKYKSEEPTELSDKLIEFDNNHSSILKNVCLELNRSIMDVERLFGKNKDLKVKAQSEKIINQMKDSVSELERL